MRFIVEKSLHKPSLHQRPVDICEIDHDSWGYDCFEASGERMVAIGPSTFREAFPDFMKVMRYLREEGLAKTEGGKQPKLMIKAPPSVANGGRVYCLYVDRIMASVVASDVQRGAR
jgi:hypothetical protein